MFDMTSNPRGDTPTPIAPPDEAAEWRRVLAHRSDDASIEVLIERFQAAGVTPSQVASHLADGGDRLYAAARTGEDGWADPYGGVRAVAVLAAEVSALMSHLVARAASVRGVCVDALLDEYSAVTVAGALGVARQKVYDLAKTDIDHSYLTNSPWRSE